MGKSKGETNMGDNLNVTWEGNNIYIFWESFGIDTQSLDGFIKTLKTQEKAILKRSKIIKDKLFKKTGITAKISHLYVSDRLKDGPGLVLKMVTNAKGTKFETFAQMQTAAKNSGLFQVVC